MSQSKTELKIVPCVSSDGGCVTQAVMSYTRAQRATQALTAVMNVAQTDQSTTGRYERVIRGAH